MDYEWVQNKFAFPFTCFLSPSICEKRRKFNSLVKEKCTDLINYLLTETNIWEKGAEKIWNYGRNNMLTEKLYNEELSNLYSSSNIIRVVKLKRIKWAGYVPHRWDEMR